MPELGLTSVTLRIIGDDLDPDEITRLMGVEPTGRSRRGDCRVSESGHHIVAGNGSWRLATGALGDLNAQIDALLSGLPSDPFIWRGLAERFECDVFCGVFVRGAAEGTELQPQILSMLGERGLLLRLDIYGFAD